MKFNLQKGRSIIKPVTLTILLVFFIHQAAFGKLLGERSNLDPFFIELIKPLDSKGIDVVAGDTSVVPLSKPNRPRIALLAGMPTELSIDDKKPPWMKEFVSGTMGIVAGTQISQKGYTAETEDQFLGKWRAAEKDKRVFLSFTSADVKEAQAIAKALQERGYVTFTFLNSGEHKPRYDTAIAGNLFSEAGHFIVLDTANSRKSPGVWLEATLARSLSMGKKAVVNGFDEQSFIDGVSKRWIVTENPEIPGKLFVHREISGGALNDLLYNIRIETNGSWTVYRPKGTKTYGTRLGTITSPPSVEIGSCNCR
jgi:hypothetical protein